MSEQLEYFALFNTKFLTLSANECVSEKFNLLHVKLGRQTELSEIRLHTVSLVSQRLYTLLQEYSVCSLGTRLSIVWLVMLIQESLNLLLCLVRKQNAHLTTHVLAEEMSIIGRFFFWRATESYLHDLVLPDKKLGVSHLALQLLEWPSAHVLERYDKASLVVGECLLYALNHLFLAHSALLLDLRQRDDLVSPRPRHLLFSI